MILLTYKHTNGNENNTSFLEVITKLGKYESTKINYMEKASSFNRGSIVRSNLGGHGGAVITLWPPTSEVGTSNPEPYGEDGGFLPVVGSLQYSTLTNCMYWFPLLIKLPCVI